MLTEKSLRREFALFRRLPKVVTQTKTIQNFTKVILRINKLFKARASALEILKKLLVFKQAIRGVIDMVEVSK